MKTKLFFITAAVAALLLSSLQKANAQNGSPYWSTNGNNNATGTSKMGTTNNIPLKFFTNNTQRMLIEANGNIGIGTTSANTKLFISDQTAVASFTGLNNAGVRIQGFNSPGNFALLGFSGFSNSYTGNLAQIGAKFANSGSSLSFGTSNNYTTGITNTAMTIDYNGNVGIGTTTPTSKLQVEGTLGISGAAPRINFAQSGSSSGAIYSSAKDLNISGATTNEQSTTNPGNLILQTGSISSFGNTYAGNVGIGTATPVTKLEVKTGNNSWGIIHSNGSVKVGAYVGSSGGWIATQSNSPLYFCTSLLNTNSTAQLTLLTNGNFGVGTLNPQYKFSVNGTIQAKEVRVETGWADYVFEKDYPLPTLESVAAFVEINKHLPGIASAKDIQQNGLAVAAMQTKMMEKIEELTLYLIEQNKQIQQLQNKIEVLEKKHAK